MSEWKKNDESSFEDFNAIENENALIYQGTIPADDMDAKSAWSPYGDGTIGIPLEPYDDFDDRHYMQMRKYEDYAFAVDDLYYEQMREHADYASAAKKLCPAGKEFLYMLPAFPILKSELIRCGKDMDLSYLDAQSVGARIREGLGNGYREHWEKASAEELVCGWFGLIYYYGIAPQYHMRVVAKEMADYMKSRQDVADLCGSRD